MCTRSSMLSAVLTFVLALAGPLAVTGCSDDDDNQNNAQDAAVGTDGWVGGTFTVVIYDMSDSVDRDTPLVGATVALDPPFDTRVEHTTDANGEVQFDAALVDWSVGNASVTAHKDGFCIGSIVNLTEDRIREREGRLEIGLFDIPTQDSTALLTGSATGMEDTDNSLLVFPMTRDSAGFSSQQGADFTLEVPATVAFQLFAMEYRYTSAGGDDPSWTQPHHHAKLIDVAAIQDGSEIVLVDYDSGLLTPTEVTGTVSLPADTSSALRSDDITFNMWIADQVMSKACGWTTSATWQAGAQTINYAMTHYDIPGMDDLSTSYQVGWRGALSLVFMQGLPSGGTSDAEFLEFPTWVQPASPTGYRSLYAPIEWSNNNSGVTPSYHVFQGDTLLWFVLGDVEDTTFTLPEAPSSVNYAAMFGSRALTGQLRTGELDEDELFYERVAIARELNLTP